MTPAFWATPPSRPASFRDAREQAIGMTDRGRHKAGGCDRGKANRQQRSQDQ